MSRFILLSSLIILVLIPCTSSAEIPQLINYQGMLTTPAGSPVSDGQYNLTFKIYGSESDNDSLWWEYHTSVDVTNGLFNVILGSISSLDLPFDTDYWLGIRVGTDSELSPRTRLASVGYAYRARVADSAVAVTPGSGSHWSVSDSIIYTNNNWGIARGGAGNILYGDSVYTHVNIGVACTTGISGQDHKYCTTGGGVGNNARETYSTVSGGTENRTSGSESTVSGGRSNNAIGLQATIGGGYDNTAGILATIGGGWQNTASGGAATVAGGQQNTALGSLSAVGGGSDNTASGVYATVGGGEKDTASGDYATIGGGETNIASGQSATIGGGKTNIASGQAATVGGGELNTGNNYVSTVGGGVSNTTSGQAATIGGGWANTASGQGATIGGGYYNTASGMYSTATGGYANNAAGDYSFAAGRKANANNHGTFVWADNTDAYFTSTGGNQFLIRASGGVGIGTTGPTGQLDVNGNDIRIRSSQTPATSSADGYTGEIAWDSNYIYICVSGDGPGGGADSWKRAALSTW